MTDLITDIADAGSALVLIDGWRDCRTEDQRGAWLLMHLAVARAGTPELLDAMREVERAEMADPLANDLTEAADADDRERYRDLLAHRAQIIGGQRRRALARLHAELVKQSVRTAVTPRSRT
jgi:hypothetical protein